MMILNINTLKATFAAAICSACLGGAATAQEVQLTESSTDWAIYVVENPKE